MTMEQTQHPAIVRHGPRCEAAMGHNGPGVALPSPPPWRPYTRRWFRSHLPPARTRRVPIQPLGSPHALFTQSHYL